jgi:hypothetical protein
MGGIPSGFATGFCGKGGGVKAVVWRDCGLGGLGRNTRLWGVGLLGFRGPVIGVAVVQSGLPDKVIGVADLPPRQLGWGNGQVDRFQMRAPARAG